MRKFRGWQPAEPNEDGKTQIYRTSPVSAIHLMSVFRAFAIGTRLHGWAENSLPGIYWWNLPVFPDMANKAQLANTGK